MRNQRMSNKATNIKVTGKTVATLWRTTFVAFALTVAVATSPAAADILARYHFDDSNTNAGDNDITTTASALVVGSGFTSTFGSPGNPAPSIVETYAQINATDLAGAEAANDFFSFTITPDLGIAMTLSSLTFDAFTGSADVSQTARFWVKSSIDGLVADFTQNTSSFTTHTVPLGASYANLTSPVQFHIYISDNGSSDASASVRLDNITLNGTGANRGFSTGEIFGLKSTEGTPSQAPTVLFRFEADSAPFYNLGVVKLNGMPIDADALAGSPMHGLLAFQISGTTSRLISIDPNTSTATAIGGFLAGRSIRGAVFNAANELLVIDNTNSQLLVINPADGTIVSTTNLTLGGNPFFIGSQNDLALETDGDLLLVTNQFTYQLNPSTGALTQLKNDGSLRFAGAATVPSLPLQLFTYETTSDEDIYQLDGNSLYASTRIIQNILPQFEATASGDLAYFVPAVVPEPAVCVVGPLATLCFLATRRDRRSNPAD